MLPVHASTLLERERERSLLERAWRDAVRGRGSAWLLCAEAGGGKTRLATEVATAVGHGPTRWGAAEPVAPPEPYLALMRALPGFEPAPTRTASLGGFLALLDAVRGPLLLVLDDLHFADEGTAATLVRLATECRLRPWLVLATARPGEGSAAVREALTELTAHGQATRLDLPPLSAAAASRLAAETRRESLVPGEAETIYAQSGGNPWLVEALARGNCAVAAARERITLRLERLEAHAAGALGLLRSLAPAARPLPHAIVADLRGGDTPDLRRTLAALRDADVLREDATGWAFRHELLRHALLDGMIAADRREAHLALAEALQARGRAAALAMHFAEAGDARTAVWARRAAEQARAVDAHAEALAQLERALAFEHDPEARRALLFQAAQEAYDLGRYPEVERLVNDAVSLPGRDPHMLAALHQAGARAAVARGDAAADARHLAAAERALAGLPPSAIAASIASARAARAALAVEPVKLAAAAEHALRLARSLDATVAASVEAQIKSFCCISLLDSGDPHGFELLDEVERLARTLALPPGFLATALGNAYDSAVLSLFQVEAERLYERAASLFRRHDLNWLPRIQPYRVLELVQRGRYTEARSLAGTLLAESGEGTDVTVLACARVIGVARSGAAVPSPVLVEGAGGAFQQSSLVELAALEDASSGTVEGPGERAQRVYGVMNRHRYARIAGVAAVCLARAGRGAPPLPRWLVPHAPLRVFWQWAEAVERNDLAVLRDVSRRLEAMGCPYEAAVALRDAGDLTAAHRAFRALDATPAREATAVLLRAAGRPVPRTTRAALHAGGLTAAEVEVARLVASGLSNDAIAAALTMSPRTVTTHLTSIYRKVGCAGRTQLALWWEREGR